VLREDASPVGRSVKITVEGETVMRGKPQRSEAGSLP
jgi:hypothetical protein